MRRIIAFTLLVLSPGTPENEPRLLLSPRYSSKRMADPTDFSNDEEMARALDAVLNAIQRGETVDEATLLQRFPQLREALSGLRGLMPSPTLPQVDSASLPVARPDRIGRYLIERELGAGSFGVVYLGYDPDVKRRVAIKLLHPGYIDQLEIVARFQREAHAGGRLRHPGIVQLFDFSRQGPPYYLVTEYVEGVDPRLWCRQRESSYLEVADLLARMAEAVDHAHRQGVCHRDLKPGNILVDGGGQPHILDFGLARLESPESASLQAPTSEGHILGSLPYMAPEQAAGHSHTADARSDVYSLGVILYELLTRQMPFQGPAHSLPARVIEGTPPPPRSCKPEIPEDLEAICLKAMAKRPRDRYGSAAELARDLRAFVAGNAVSAARSGWLSHIRRVLDRRHLDTLRQGWTLLLALLGVIILIGSVVCNYWEIHLTGPKRWLAILTTKAVQVGVMIFLAVRLRPEATIAGGVTEAPLRMMLTMTSAERQIWSLVPGYYGSFLTLILVNLFREPDIPLAPILAMLSGMGFATLGATIWGWFYVWSGFFFVLTFAVVFGAPYGLAILGVGWCLCLVVGSIHLYVTR